MFSINYLINSRDLRLDSDVVLASQDLEVSVVSPVAVPAVGGQPVLGSLFDAPAEYANGMTAKSLAGDVLVNAFLVLHEVLVDGERSLNRSVGRNLQLDFVLVALDRVRALAEMLVSLEVDLVVGVGAFVLALRRRSSAAARHSGSVDVVLARLNLVRLAADVRSEGSTAHDSFANPVRPGAAGKAAVTTESTSVTARHEMLRGQSNMRGAVGVDASAITHRLDCAKGLKITQQRQL